MCVLFPAFIFLYFLINGHSQVRSKTVLSKRVCYFFGRNNSKRI